MKKCNKCNKIKPLKDFFKESRTKNGLRGQCKICDTLSHKNRIIKLKDKGIYNLMVNNWNKVYRWNTKIEIIKGYGGKCKCCGEKRPEFLTIDHINNDGKKDRTRYSGYQFYQWIKKNKFPKSLQLLCFNCNSSFGLFGYCPHRPSIRRERK